MMLKWYKIICVFSLCLLMGCVDNFQSDPFVDREDNTFTLYIKSFSDKEIGATRAASSENNIYRGYIFFYDKATGAYKGYESMADKEITYNGTTLSFEVGSDYSITDKVIAVFNHDESATLPSDFSQITSDNVDANFPISSDYLAKIEKDMNKGEYALGMPMCVNDFTDSDRATREIYRSVARMELYIKEGLTITHDSHTHAIDSSNLSFVVVNNINVGSVAFGSLSAAVSDIQGVESCFDIDNFDNKFPYRLTQYSDTDPVVDTSNKIYLHEFPYTTMAINGKELSKTAFDKNRFAIILRHGDTNIYPGSPVDQFRYYKLNLLDKATSTYFDVTRNHNYRVVIKAVNSRGYDSLKEAYDMPPSNIEYEIYDDKGGLTYSNGQYAISMDEILSYDEVLVYGNNETKIEFNNIRYVLPYDGQMDDAHFATNEVEFSIINNSDTLITDTKNEFATNKKLTADGRSISLTLTGEGECTIALRIKLGNLEMGRDEITIKKIAPNGEGNGAFDAHPGQLRIDNQEFVAGSWRSDDIDFGARASSNEYKDEVDGGTVIYMGENATPTGYRTMDGAISGQYSLNSYPVFSPKTRKGYYSYKKADGKITKVMIQLEQLAPFYIGHFGSATTGAGQYHYNGLITEKIEEIEEYDYGNNKIGEINGMLEWSKMQKTYYTETIWGDYKGLGDRYLNLVEGLAVTKNIVENNTSEATLPTAAHYCYMKNDVNGNGRIDANEPIKWYLPAQNQMLAMWVNMNVFDTDIDLYKLNVTLPYYWTCSEVDDIYDFINMKPIDFSTHAIKFNMLEGQADYETKNNSWLAGKCHVRCVRDLN